ncbi:hypothetical protein SAMN05216312_11225 [Cohnella sp. OV330]|uniref:hypothetical protein n=1 Tax=Cohnella sp. OV330 TaxID=1855288 RepID=UPI0008F26D06|nr:hypothetical protein [Cohnella sp. OV330]SFB53623.1 hypothetical protein SAMN05216312_11225 [Cohnella sp. OV330]
MLHHAAVAPLYPWAGKPSAYDMIVLRTGQDGKLKSQALPDDDEYADKPERREALRQQGLEAIGPIRAIEDEGVAKELTRLLARLSRDRNVRNRRAAYLALMREESLDAISPALQALHKLPGLNAGNLYEEALWMARHSVHRNVVKFGLALLSQYGSERHRELTFTLGKHEEFTLYAASALMSMEQSNKSLCELARCIDGWGRIYLVERLDPETQEIRDWLLREGFRNRIGDGLLAYTCALKGDLEEALQADAIDPSLYEGAGGILAALIAGGPAEDIDDYEQAMPVIGEYLRHAERMCADAARLAPVRAIEGFLEQDERVWEKRYANGWTPEARMAYLAMCRSIAGAAASVGRAADERTMRT